MPALVPSAVHWLRAYPGVPLRRSLAQAPASWPKLLPRPVLQYLDLDGQVVSPVKLELGCGPFPTPGYVHMDLDRSARHLEFVGPAWDLPFSSGTVQEVLAVHVLEHVHPARLPETLTEWHRVLLPGGFVQIHVPNAPEIFRSFESASIPQKWALVNALLGMYGSSEIGAPGDIPETSRSDHQVMYDFKLLEDVLKSAGFELLENLTGVVSDRHCEAWGWLVKDFSLIVRATKSVP